MDFKPNERWCLAALRALSAGVVIVDPLERVLFANPRAAEILGRALEALEGAALSEVLVPWRILLEATEKDRGRSEVYVPVGDGTTRSIGFSLAHFDSEASTERARICLFQDTAGVHELRRQRDHLMKMAAVSALLPALLHELKSPIAALTTMLEVMIEGAPHQSQLAEDLYALIGEVRRMNLQLQGLGVVGGEARSARFHAIDQALREVVRILEPQAEQRSLSLIAQVRDLPLLPLDPAVIRSLVANLVNNALAATEPGGSVWVRGQLDADGWFTLEVEDTGAGMSPAVLQRATELFFTTKPGGSGIGLALCARAVERSGGKLEITSTVGVGTRIRASFPARDILKR